MSIWLPDRKRKTLVTPDGSVAVRVKKNPLDRIHSEPTPPPAWRRRLEQVWPHSEKTQWFNFRMFPVERPRTDRWALYAMTPAALIADQTKIAQLSGTPWWEMPHGQQYGRMTMVSAYQWEMWRQYKCWARPYWCLQGEDGGTPMQYSLRESAILRAAGLPLSVPEPGDEPFAPFDERTMSALVARDRFRQLGSALDRLSDPTRAEADMKAEEAEAEMLFRTEFVKYFKARMEPNAEFIASHSRKSENQSEFKPATKGEIDAADQWEDHYIATGFVPVAKPD